jgi:lysophospholipase L1-like esterase
VFEGIEAVINAVHERKPNATIILQSLLPTQEESKNRDVVLPVNKRLARIVSSEPFSRYIRFFDAHATFVDASGRQLTQYFVDGLHPNETGYRVWRDRLVPFLQQVRASRAGTPAGK